MSDWKVNKKNRIICNNIRNMKVLEINLTKYVQDSYTKNHKTPMEKSQRKSK